MKWIEQYLMDIFIVLFNTKTLKNKLYSLLLIVCTLPVIFLEGDATATIFMGLIAIPVFFAKRNWIHQKEGKHMTKTHSKGDVAWYIPGRKRPIAYSTKASSDLISVLAEEGGTISEVQQKINYNAEAKDVLQAYIDLGYGNIEARKWFK